MTAPLHPAPFTRPSIHPSEADRPTLDDRATPKAMETDNPPLLREPEAIAGPAQGLPVLRHDLFRALAASAPGSGPDATP